MQLSEVTAKHDHPIVYFPLTLTLTFIYFRFQGSGGYVENSQFAAVLILTSVNLQRWGTVVAVQFSVERKRWMCSAESIGMAVVKSRCSSSYGCETMNLNPKLMRRLRFLLALLVKFTCCTSTAATDGSGEFL